MLRVGQVTVQDSKASFEGGNTMAAMVAATLAHGSNQYVHGVKAVGIASPAVQCKLRQQSQPVEQDAAHESADAAAGSSLPESLQPQTDDPPAAAAPTQQQTGVAAAAVPAANAPGDPGASDQPHSPSVLVQTATLPPVQLVKQPLEQPAQPGQQQRVVQTGTTAAAFGTSPGGNAAACSQSPLPPVGALDLSLQQPAVSTADAPTAPLSPATPAATVQPQIELFKPSPSRAATGLASAGEPPAEQLPTPSRGQQHQQGLPLAGFAVPSGPSLWPGSLPSAQPQPGGAFTPFSAGQPAPALLTAPLASPMSPFLAARAAARAAASSGHVGPTLQGAQLPQLSVPSWSGSNYSSTSMMSPSIFSSSIGDGSGHDAGALDAASIDLRSLSNGSFNGPSSLSRGSWGARRPRSTVMAGSSPLLGYFGPLTAGLSCGCWDPVAVAALAHTARLSGNESAAMRAIAAAAMSDPAAGSAAGGASGGGRAVGDQADPGSPAGAAAASAVVVGKRPPPRVTAAAPAVAATAADDEDALGHKPPTHGRLTPEALSLGAAAAEGLLTSQGLLNPSAATVKAPRIAAKGWTAFTAFGLHTRNAVRSANPGATSIEVEKLVGQLWGRLSRDEKQGWVQRAARARSARGAGSGSSQAKGKRKRPAPAAEAAASHDSNAECPTVNRRQRSSRIRRRPAHHDAAESVPGRDASPRSPQGGLHAPGGAAVGAGGSMGGGGGGGGAVTSTPKSQAAAELELEVGTLEVLASMQAAAADSRRGFPA